MSVDEKKEDGEQEAEAAVEETAAADDGAERDSNDESDSGWHKPKAAAAPHDPVPGLEAEVRSLRAALADSEQRANELEGRLRQVSTAWRQKSEEIENTKDRLARHAQVQEEIRRGEVVTTIFEPVENLNRSIEASSGLPLETLAGLRMVHAEFMTALNRLGLQEVSATGGPFNPNEHEAIATMPVTDKRMADAVVAVVSTGYRIGNRLIRPARVVIGAMAEEA